jgi:DnaJ-class molecular chaperone
MSSRHCDNCLGLGWVSNEAAGYGDPPSYKCPTCKGKKIIVKNQKMIDHVIAALFDHYYELDDSGDSPFGEYAECDRLDDFSMRIGNEDTNQSVIVTVK